MVHHNPYLNNSPARKAKRRPKTASRDWAENTAHAKCRWCEVILGECARTSDGIRGVGVMHHISHECMSVQIHFKLGQMQVFVRTWQSRLGCYIRGTGTVDYIHDWLLRATVDGRNTMQTKMQTIVHTTDKRRRRTQ